MFDQYFADGELHLPAFNPLPKGRRFVQLEEFEEWGGSRKVKCFGPTNPLKFLNIADIGFI